MLPLQKQIIVDPLSFSEERFRPSLEERLESIISGAALMADSSCTRDDRRERIVAECNAVRQALQDLLSEYMGNVSIRTFLWRGVFHNRCWIWDVLTINVEYVFGPLTLSGGAKFSRDRFCWPLSTQLFIFKNFKLIKSEHSFTLYLDLLSNI